MLHWEPVDARLSYPVDAYEVEVMSLQERHLGWRSLDDAVETVKPRNEVQTINIRVDKGSTVAGGYFQIYAAFDGISPLNTDAFDTPRTEATAYDGALREFNQPTLDLRTQTMSAPMPSAGFGSIPVLGIYKETVSLGVSWTGPGPAVSVWRAGSSLPCGAAEWRTSPKHPVSGVVGGGGRPPPAPLCAYNATSLAHPGGLYAFRIAAHNAAAAQQAAASAPPAATYELQYRQDEAAPWVDAPAPIDVDGSGWATATLYGLEAGAAVFARANAAGASPWSLSSNGGVATRDPKPPVPSAPVATLDGGDGAILVRFLPFAADGLGSRSATVARHFELGTQAWKGRGFAAPVGWDVAYDRPLPYVLTDAVDEIQLATSRCDAGAISGGTFRLRLPVRGAYERGTVTGDLPFDASAFAVKKALEALDVVPEGSLAVTRHTPGALESHAPARGAFAWKVHFKDIGAVAGADLRATGVFPALEPENVDLSCAYSGDGVGVVVERLQVGSLETYRDALDAEVFNVEPNTRYRFRARAVDGRARRRVERASAWVATNDALRVFETVGRSTQRRAEARSLKEAAVGWAAARQRDPDYVGGAGDGGDGDGNGGLVVLAAYDGAAAHPIKGARGVFYAAGRPQTYVVPRRLPGRPGAKRLVAKLWGGGGGGAGAGRGEANATSRATEALVDDLRLDKRRRGLPVRVALGRPGGDADGARRRRRRRRDGLAAGRGRLRRRRRGARRVVRRRRRRSEVVRTSDGAVLAVAGGGGGAGASDYCCGHGGGGGGDDGEDGYAPGLATPVDVGLYGAARDEYSAVDGDGSGTIAVDVGGSDARDLSGPHARHRHVDLGEAPGADYSAVAAGGGASQGAGGDPGAPGSFEALWGALSPPTPVVADANHSAVSLAWPPNDAATYFWAERYHVEMAEGDVGGFKLVAVRAAADGGVDVAGLDSDAAYRFRLRGANQTATSPPGEAVACRTLPHPRDEWVRVHRPSRPFPTAATAPRRRARPPHYSMGAQTGLGADDAASESAAGRAADAPTEFYPSAPSGRQGHSLTRLGGAPEIRAYRLPSAELGAVFLFGGHGDGYECDGAVGATFRLGAYRWRGFDNERCVRRMGASDELWRLDAGLLEWELIRPGRNASWPPPRSRHVAAAVGGFVAVFGGVKEPDPRYVEDGDLEFAYYRDLWLLDVGAPRRATWSWTAGSAVDPVFVPDARTTYFDVNVTAGDEWCLRDVDIYVRISHPCASQLSISVVGPGPVSGDGNFRDPVAASWPVLLHAPDANSEACDRLDPPFSTQDALNDFGYKGDPGMLFDDDAPVDVRAPDAKNPYGGTFRPVDALAEFEGARPSGTWTLVVTDHSGGLRKNYNAANLTAFRVVSRLERCERRYVWRNVTNATGDAPPALAGALGVSTGDSLFVYGGRTASDPFPDKALWRYDILTNAWTALSAAPQPEGVYDPVGKAAVITPWGIYAFGGLGGWHDERGLPCSQFDGRVLWLDMLSNRWWGLDDEVWPGPHEIEVDPGRHRVDGAFVVAATPGVADVVSAAADVRAGLLPDTDAAVPPAILLFGGDDDFSDLDDAWLLKLGNASLRHTSDPRFEFHLSPSFHFAFCGWRFQGKSQELWDASCGANATTSPMEDCEFVEVVQRAYCEHQYQSLNHLPY
ncbi:fibronectin type 3 domain-containing protein [Aureococcus anophagefferens]|nr:fibronectin type 3 domain-containing protein [Aureococcus anophagefferens]